MVLTISNVRRQNTDEIVINIKLPFDLDVAEPEQRRQVLGKCFLR